MFDKNLANYYIIPKQYVFIGLVLFNILLFAVKTALSRRLIYRRSIIDISLLALLLIALISSIFSKDVYGSFLGRGDYFILSFTFLLFLVLFYFIFVNNIISLSRWRTAIDALFITGGVASVLFILKNFFAISIPHLGTVLNLTDSSNSAFGVWCVVLLVFSGGMALDKKISLKKSIFYCCVALLSYLPLLIISFKYLWWLVLVGLILLLLLGVSFAKQIRIGWLTVLFSLLVITSVFIIFGSPVYLQKKLPVEVSLGVSPSWSVVKNVLFSGAKPFLFGDGLGSFVTDFSKYRTANFNYDSLAWSLRFYYPFNSFFAILSEGGVPIALVLLFLLFLVFGYILNLKSSRREKFDIGLDALESEIIDFNPNQFKSASQFSIYLVLVVWLVAWVGMFFVFYTTVLWFLWWLILGLLITGLALSGSSVVKEKIWELKNTPQYNMVSSFGLVIVILGMILLAVCGAKYYFAEIYFAKAVQNSNLKEAETQLDKAISLRGNVDLYHVALARVYLREAADLAKKQNPDTQSVAILAAKAVNVARVATQLSPNSASIWENLATMYENAYVIVPQAGDWSIKSLETAFELEPTNAYLSWRLAGDYAVTKNYTKAIEYYKKSIDLKKDYIGAYTSLARVYEINNEMDKAINIYKDAFVLGGSNNSEFLFNFGRLLYNRNTGTDRKDAEQLWLAVEKIQPNYSNALYSLGLYYESIGDKNNALNYYNKAKALNLDNADIQKKIQSLTTASAQKVGTSTKK
jgi:tetratricopeptide (TPR) repeat protein